MEKKGKLSGDEKLNFANAMILLVQIRQAWFNLAIGSTEVPHIIRLYGNMQ